MDKNAYLKFIASFMVVLILTLPVYSANAYASLQVTQNAGEDNIEGYLNAEGDRWQLDVLASHDDGSAVTENDIRVNGVPFDDCTATSGLGTECSYSVDFRSNSRRPGVRPVTIELLQSNGQVVDQLSTNVILDGAEPEVTATGVQKEGNLVEITYSVNEKPSSDCVGLEKIEFVHNNNVLKTIDGTALDAIGDDTCDGTRHIDNDAVESVPEQTEEFTISTTGTGVEEVHVIATDRFGHEGKHITGVIFDGTAPVIDGTTFLIVGYDRFVAGGDVKTDLSVNITDDNVVTATMSSSDLGVTDVDAICVATGSSDNGRTVYTCTWEDIDVTLTGSIAITITANDAHRTTTRTVTKQFTVDSSGPVLEEFRTNFSSQQVFVKARDNTFIATLTEAGSGVNPEDVIADFHNLDRQYGTRTAADTCTQLGSSWTCVWQGIDAGRLSEGEVAIVEIIEARDDVGNLGTFPTGVAALAVERDDTAPTVKNVRAVVQGQQGIRNFFQSQDDIFITFEVEDPGSVRAFIDPSMIIDGAGLLEAECLVGEDDTHICSITTPQIDQFDGREVRVPLYVYDGAGNLAKDRNDLPALSFAVFGTDEDVQNPDFWNVRVSSLTPTALDAGISQLIPQRLFVNLALSSSASTVEILQSQVISCEGAEGHEEDAQLIQRAYMTNNFFESRNPVLVIELEPFDALAGTEETDDDTEELKLKCTIGLQSKRGNQVVQQIEEEVFNVDVKLFLSPFDDGLRALENEIDSAKDKATQGVFKVIDTLDEIFTWVRIICRIISIIFTISMGLQLVKAAGDGARGFPPTLPLAIGICVETSTASATINGGLDYLYIMCAIASCSGQYATGANDQNQLTSVNAGSTNLHPILKTYFEWQTGVLEAYNLWMSAGLISSGPDSILGDNFGNVGSYLSAKSLYDNAGLSVAGLCLPGIIYNVEKHRQIQCRYVGCLENEVKAGVASVEACRELKSYQRCKYWTGELFHLIPGVELASRISELVKQILRDPVALLRVTILVGCQAAFCAESGTLEGWCEYLGYFVYILDFVNTIISTWQQIQTTTEKDFCEQVGL